MTLRELKIDELCKMLEISDRLKPILLTILQNPTGRHKDFANTLGLTFSCYQHRAAFLYRILEVHSKKELSEKVEYLVG